MSESIAAPGGGVFWERRGSEGPWPCACCCRGQAFPAAPSVPEGTRTTESSEERQARPRAGETQKGGRGGADGPCRHPNMSSAKVLFLRGRWQPLSPIWLNDVKQGTSFTRWWRRRRTTPLQTPCPRGGPQPRCAWPGAHAPRPRPDPGAPREPRRLPEDEAVICSVRTAVSCHQACLLQSVPVRAVENLPWPV